MSFLLVMPNRTFLPAITADGIGFALGFFGIFVSGEWERRRA